MPADRGVDVFATVIVAPYTTVFADPPASLSFGRGSGDAPSQRSPPCSPDNHRFSSVTSKYFENGSTRATGDATKQTSLTGHTKHTNFVRTLAAYTRRGKNAGLPDRAQWWVDRRKKEEQLWLAAETANMDLLQDSLHGEPTVNLEARSLYGRTALHIASSTGNVECMELLLKARANLEARTNAGFTALHIASQHGHVCGTTLLLQADADPLSVECAWNLPLHLSAAHGRKDIVALLLNANDGCMAQQLASRNSMGQRAAAISLDIETAEIFRHFEAMAASSNSSEHSVDDYAARTIDKEGGVLLHNSRSDIVRRLLHKTQHPRNTNGEYLIESNGSEDDSIMQFRSRPNIGSKQTTNSSRAPFAQMRIDRLEIEKVGPDSFEYVDMLGKGSFGEVYKVRHKGTKELFAMKIQRKTKVVQENILRYAVTERNVLCYIRHPYIVDLHFAFQTSNYLVLVLKLCSGGNVQDLLAREKRLHTHLARLYAAEVLLGFIHLHERSIVYRDLKPENVLLDGDQHAVLADFGLSKEGVMSDDNRTLCGSLAYLAPEVLRRQGHGRTVDVYGLGVLIFTMRTGSPPYFHQVKEVLFHNIKYARLSFPEYVEEAMQDLIRNLMERDPLRRLGSDGTSDVKAHEFFACIDFEKLMNREIPVPGREEPSSPMERKVEGTRGKSNDPFSPQAKRKAGVAEPVDGWSWQKPE